jgi:hypothetical protein
MSDEQKPRDDDEVEGHGIGPVLPLRADEAKTEDEEEGDVEAHGIGPVLPMKPSDR